MIELLTDNNNEWSTVVEAVQRSDRGGRALSELVRDNQSLKTKCQRNKTSAALAKMMLRRQTLPAWGYRENILSIIADNQVVVIQGMTGCGKSTQVVYNSSTDRLLIINHKAGPGFICIYRIYRTWWWWYKLIMNINIWLLIWNTYYRTMFNT